MSKQCETPCDRETPRVGKRQRSRRLACSGGLHDPWTIWSNSYQGCNTGTGPTAALASRHAQHPQLRRVDPMPWPQPSRCSRPSRRHARRNPIVSLCQLFAPTCQGFMKRVAPFLGFAGDILSIMDSETRPGFCSIIQCASCPAVG